MSVLTAVALIIVAGVLGGLGGFALRGAWRGRHKTRTKDPTVAELLYRLIQSSGYGVVVLDRTGTVVLHNPRAEMLGLMRAGQADLGVRAAAGKALARNDSVQVILSTDPGRRQAPVAVLGQARRMGDGFVVVEAADRAEAARLEATRRDFVANVSHELKTPVGAIALLAEAVLDAAEDATEVRRFAKLISRESTRLGTLVTELITLSRLQGAERLPDLNVVEIDAVVRDALSRTKISAESVGITVTTDAPSGLLVDGDHTLLVTALTNLLNNAIAYSSAGSPVTVSRRMAEDRVEVAVTDRGIGIADHDQQRVFERFYRVDKARSRATGGTGLGLAIVKHVAANHGGDVRLWSSLGVGSTFTLRIPAHRGTPADRARGTGKA